MDRKLEKKAFTPQRAMVAVAALLLVLFFIYQVFFADNSGSLTVKADRLTISEAQVAPFMEFILVNGSVIPIRTIYLDAVEGGRVERILMEGGELVERGDTILVMANNNLQLDVLNRETQILEQINNLQNTRLALQQERLSLRTRLLEAQTNLAQREREYRRDQELYDRELVARHVYEESKLRYEEEVRRRTLLSEQAALDSISTENQLRHIDSSIRRMQTNLNLVQRSMDYLVLRAPVGGQLTAIDAEIGESMQRGQRIGQIDVLDGYKVRAGIDEHYISRVKPGQSGEFEFAGTTSRMVISKIYPEVTGGRFEVDLEFDGPTPEGIRRGQTVRIRLGLGDLDQALLVPRGGFFQQTGGNWVFVLDPDGRTARRRDIRIGRQNPQFFEVLEGLEPGDRVITSSYEAYGDRRTLTLQTP